MEHDDAQRQQPTRATPPHATCIVVDDHPAVLGTVCDLLAQSGFSVVGRARTAAGGREKIERRRPTVAIVDVRLPDGSGVELTRELRRTVPATRVILYTADVDSSLVSDAVEAGARGIVRKSAPLSDLVRAVETVARGETYVDAALS